MEISTKTLHFIEEHREDDTRTLALQSKKYPDVDMAAAVTQIAGRQVAARKIPSWYPVSALWYPPHLSMEQCSSEATDNQSSNDLLSDFPLSYITTYFSVRSVSRSLSASVYSVFQYGS